MTAAFGVGLADLRRGILVTATVGSAVTVIACSQLFRGRVRGDPGQSP